MAPRKRTSKKSDAQSRKSKVIHELETVRETDGSQRSNVSLPKPNAWCMSDQQIDDICNMWSHSAKLGSRQSKVHHHCITQPALTPIEMDYFIKLLKPVSQEIGDMDDFSSFTSLELVIVTEKFNKKSSPAPAGAKQQPRKMKVLKCALQSNFHEIRSAILRDRCERAHEGTGNAETNVSWTPEQLFKYYMAGG